jgi:hypothetical protein
VRASAITHLPQDVRIRATNDVSTDGSGAAREHPEHNDSAIAAAWLCAAEVHGWHALESCGSLSSKESTTKPQQLRKVVFLHSVRSSTLPSDLGVLRASSSVRQRYPLPAFLCAETMPVTGSRRIPGIPDPQKHSAATQPVQEAIAALPTECSQRTLTFPVGEACSIASI